ncbi:MAG: CAP domain-containing protein [Bacteroidota bacterium]
MKYTLLIIVGILLISACEDEPGFSPPPGQLSVFARNLVNAHNEIRTPLGIENLEWDEELAEKAEAVFDLENCEIPLNMEDLGQNSLFAFGLNTERQTVNLWANAGNAYNYDQDTCLLAAGSCDSYKQLVWANSKKLGCARGTCLDGSTFVWVCLYDPKGNIEGERPY